MAIYSMRCLLLCSVLASVVAQPSEAQITRLAAIGDSLTDEYAEEGYGSYARAWTELLVEERGVSLGPTAGDAVPPPPGGDWAEPRRTGYQDNWARFGATTDDAISSGQHTGVRDGIDNRGTSHVVVHIGGNDRSPWAGDYSSIYNDALTSGQLDQLIDDYMSNLATLLASVDGTAAEVVVASVMDFSAMPWITGSFADPAARDRVTAVFARIRDRVRAFAREQGYAFADLFGYSQVLFGSNAALRSTLSVGGVSVDLRNTDNGVDPASGWVSDGVHPHTVVQGLWANVYAAALNTYDSVSLVLFTEQELVENAGLVFDSGGPQLPSDLADFAAFVEAAPLFYSGFESGNLDDWAPEIR